MNCPPLPVFTWKSPELFMLDKLILMHSLMQMFQTIGYTLLTSGASCEASGFGSITSLAECQTAPQELGISFTKRGTVDSPGAPSGCYHRFDGDLWYNENEHSTAPCTSSSRCVCKTVGKPLHWCVGTPIWGCNCP